MVACIAYTTFPISGLQKSSERLEQEERSTGEHVGEKERKPTTCSRNWTRPDTQPISSRWRWAGAVMRWVGAEWGRAGLYGGRAGAILFRNHHSSRFRVIKIFALPSFLPTYLRTHPLIESLSQRLKSTENSWRSHDDSTIRKMGAGCKELYEGHYQGSQKLQGK